LANHPDRHSEDRSARVLASQRTDGLKQAR